MKKLFLFFLFSATLINAHEKISNAQAIVLAAGKSSRFQGPLSKLITPLCGQPIVLYPIKAIAKYAISTIVVVGYKKEEVCQVIDAEHLSQISYVEESLQKGTGHAVLVTQPKWSADHIMVINGDMPITNHEIIYNLWKKHIDTNADMTFVIAKNTTPGIARVVAKGNHTAIVEAKHFTDSIDKYPYTNAGIYFFKRSFLETYLPLVEPNEKTKEYYLTELAKIASDNGLKVATIIVPFDDIRGINTLEEFKQAEKIMMEQNK